MSETCELCGALLCMGGCDCLRRQLAAANERYRKLACVVMACEPGEEPTADEQCVLDIAAEGVHYTKVVSERVEREDELARLRATIRHCEHCGGSWVDDGLQADCHCREIGRLRAAGMAVIQDAARCDPQHGMIAPTIKALVMKLVQPLCSAAAEAAKGEKPSPA